LSLPEHGYHAINENFDWGQAGRGMEMFCRYFARWPIFLEVRSLLRSSEMVTVRFMSPVTFR